MKNKVLAVLGSVLVLAGCESGPDQNVNVSSTATPGTQDHLRDIAGDRVFFDTNKASLTAEAKKVAAAQAGWMKTYENVKAKVGGHCDERGTREYNLALGKKRAHALKHELVKQGVANKRLKTTSFGKDNPPVAGTGEDVWQQNRVAIVEVQ